MFAALPDASIEELSRAIQRRSYSAGETIFSAGSDGNALYIIAKGDVKIVVTSPTGQPITLAMLGPGDTFGELSLLDGGRRSADARADAPTDLLTLFRDDFLRIIEADPSSLRALLATLAGMIRNMNVKVAEFAMLDVAGRISKVLLEMAERHGRETSEGVRIDKPLAYADIASLCGLYPVEVERVMANYQYEGYLLRDAEGWLIRRPDVLRRSVGLS